MGPLTRVLEVPERGFTKLIEVVPFPASSIGLAGIEPERRASELVVAPGGFGLVHAEDVEIVVRQIERLMGFITGLDRRGPFSLRDLSIRFGLTSAPRPSARFALWSRPL